MILTTVRVLCLVGAAFAAPGLFGDILVDFEGFSGGDTGTGVNLTSQYAGLTFSNAAILAEAVSFTNPPFLPHSGVAMGTDVGAPVVITLHPAVIGSPVNGFSGYFTYLTRLTIKAFDASNNQIGPTKISQFTENSNDGFGVDAPNELISLAANDIRSIQISGDQAVIPSSWMT